MRIVPLTASFLLLASCNSKQGTEVPFDAIAYQSEIEAWHQRRVENLKGARGWLNVAGLFWLEDGINTFGSGEKNNIVFPAGKIAESAGFFVLNQNVVTLEVTHGVGIIHEGKPVKSMVIYHPDSARSAVLDHDPLQWHIIKRDTKFGVRLRDFKNPELEKFHGIERYAVDAEWRITATFEQADSNRTIQITNIIGQTIPQPSPGTLHFEIKGKKYSLDAIDEGGDEYFMIFGDPTNAKETYGAGRYLYVSKPDAEGKMIIDFNKAYNPPCAFTEFATCPLPPRQNVLDLEITAGEKNYEHKQ